MTLEDLIEFAVRRGGSVRFTADREPRLDAFRLSLSAQLTDDPGLGRDEVLNVDRMVGRRDLRDAKYPAVKLAVSDMAEQFADAMAALEEEEELKRVMGRPR